MLDGQASFHRQRGDARHDALTIDGGRSDPFRFVQILQHVDIGFDEDKPPT
jgi:hypothetical protein